MPRRMPRRTRRTTRRVARRRYTNRRQEHPLFPTTTGQLGRLDPTLADMPPLWTGKQGVFTQARVRDAVPPRDAT